MGSLYTQKLSNMSSKGSASAKPKPSAASSALRSILTTTASEPVRAAPTRGGACSLSGGEIVPVAVLEGGGSQSKGATKSSSKPNAMDEDEQEEEEDDLDSEDEESEEDDDEEDDSIVEDDDDEEFQDAILEENSENPLVNLSPEALDALYDKRSAELLNLKSSNRLTGGQYVFQQKCLDLEFRHLAEMQELKAGKAARGKNSNSK
jgi:hypothetical protein